MKIEQTHPAIKPGKLTARDLMASLALAALGLVLAPVLGVFVLLVN
jgi:hypothetical protein